MKYLQDLLAELPSDLRVATVTAAAALLGVVTGLLATWFVIAMNRRDAHQRLRIRLQHDARETHQAADRAVRRQLLIAAADEAYAQTRLLKALGEVNGPGGEQASTAGDIGDLSKAHIVASLATIQSFDAVFHVMRQEVANLMVLRAAVDAKSTEIAQSAAHDLVSDARHALRVELEHRQEALRDAAVQARLSYRRALARATVEVRRELEWGELDFDAYLRYVEESEG